MAILSSPRISRLSPTAGSIFLREPAPVAPGRILWKQAALWAVGWLLFLYVILPSAGNRWGGESSWVRFDPTVSVDYNCIYVEGHARASFAVPWLVRSTPIEYLRIRYSPIADDQCYGIMFVDPRTLAFEAHSGFAKHPGKLSGKLDSPALVRDWMHSQPKALQAASHEGDAREIYQAILALAATDLEHFTLPAGTALSHFQVGYTSITEKGLPHLVTVLGGVMPLILIALSGRRKA